MPGEAASRYARTGRIPCSLEGGFEEVLLESDVGGGRRSCRNTIVVMADMAYCR